MNASVNRLVSEQVTQNMQHLTNKAAAAPCSQTRPMDLSEQDLRSLIETHQSEVWRYLRYLGAQSAEADDLTQETFLSVARSKFEKRTDRESARYLRTTARNQLISLRRKQSREVLTDQFEADETCWEQNSSGDLWDFQIDAIRDCVEQLEGRAKQAINLHYREKTSRQAIAELLGMKPDGVKTLLRRTRALLRECVQRAMNQSSVLSD